MQKLSELEFKSKYDKYYILLSHISYSYLKNVNDVEDVIQEVFMKYYILNKRFKDDSYEKNWLIRVTINKSIDYLRKRKHIVIDNELVYGINDNIVNNDLNYLVDKLSEKYKKVIILFYYNNLSINEISRILNISENNVKVRLNRARDILRKMEDSI